MRPARGGQSRRRSSTYGVCYGAVSWHVLRSHAGALDLSDRSVVLSLRYFDNVKPSTPWEVVLYVDHGVDDAQTQAPSTSCTESLASSATTRSATPSSGSPIG